MLAIPTIDHDMYGPIDGYRKIEAMAMVSASLNSWTLRVPGKRHLGSFSTFICPWSLTEGADLKQSRYVVLIHYTPFNSRSQDGTTSPRNINYERGSVRMGIFLMDSCYSNPIEWMRRRLRCA